MKSIVDRLLDEIKEQADRLTQEEKVELIEKLPTVLGVNVSKSLTSVLGVNVSMSLTSKGQQQSQINTVSGINQLGTANSLNFATQQAGGNVTSSQTNTIKSTCI